jgi:hypothetical protein
VTARRQGHPLPSTVIDLIVPVAVYYGARGLGGALWPVTFLVLQVVTNVYFARSGLWGILRTGHAAAGTYAAGM